VRILRWETEVLTCSLMFRGGFERSARLLDGYKIHAASAITIANSVSLVHSLERPLLLQNDPAKPHLHFRPGISVSLGTPL